MHGGKSTGARTEEGLARSRRANWMTGYYSREAIEARRIANRETVEQGMVRIEREERRRQRLEVRRFRAMTRESDRRLGRVR
jgi:hypothetical protein